MKWQTPPPQIPGTAEPAPWLVQEGNESTAETAQGPKSPCGRRGVKCRVGGAKKWGHFSHDHDSPNSAVCVVTIGVFLRINKNW